MSYNLKKWDEHTIVDESTVLLVPRSSEDIYIEFSTEYSYPRVETWIYSDDLSDQAILLYMYQNVSDIECIEGFSEDSVLFISTIRSLSITGKVAEISYLVSCCEREVRGLFDIEGHWKGLTKIRAAIKVQFECMLDVNRQFFEKTAYDPTPLERRENNWWNIQVRADQLNTKLIQHRDKIRKFDERGSMTKVLWLLNLLIAHIRDMSDSQSPMRYYCNYFFVLSEYSCLNHRAEESLLLAHRSMECLLIHFGLASDVLSMKADGSVRFSSHYDKKVNVPNLMTDVLSEYQALHYRQKLNELNRIRNTSKLTHGIYSVTSHQVVFSYLGVLRDIYADFSNAEDLKSVRDINSKASLNIISNALSSDSDFGLMFEKRNEP